MFQLLLRAAAAAAVCSAGPGSAVAATDPTGPALSVPVADLRASLTCSPNLARATVEPVLLVPATL